MKSEDDDFLKPERNLGGRPRKELDLDIIKRAASIGCTVDEIASLCGVSKTTMHERMREDPYIVALIDSCRDTGKASLRRLQWQGAQDGNPTMLIWLGKQLLGQKDKQELSGPNDGPLQFEDVTNDETRPSFVQMLTEFTSVQKTDGETRH